MDDELLTVKAAGKLVGKSASTVRRWVRGGKLDRHEGVQVSGGGSPPVMVAKHQLLALAGITAGVQVSGQVSGEHVQASTRAGVQVSNSAVKLAELNGELSTVRVQLEAATARLEAMTARLERQEESHSDQLRDLRQTLHDTRQDLSDWRDRHDHRAAELRALRIETGRSWWRRLLPGPSAPSDEL